MTTATPYQEALSWFGLREDPFARDDGARFFFPAEPHEETITHCMRAIGQQIGIALVTGGAGAGKSMVVRELKNRLDAVGGGRRFVTHLADGEAQGRPPNALLRDLGATLGIRRRTPNYRLFDAVEREAWRLLNAGTATVLLIDRAEELEEPLLGALVHLFNLVSPRADRFLLRIVLFARPTFLRTLRAPGHEALKIRMVFGVPALGPMSRGALGSLIEHRLRVAGGPDALFGKEVLDLLHAESGGVPGRALTLAAHSLEQGFGGRERAIGRAHVVRAAAVADLCPTRVA